MVLKSFWSQYAGIKTDMTYITSCRNAISIEHMASALALELYMWVPYRTNLPGNEVLHFITNTKI